MSSSILKKNKTSQFIFIFLVACISFAEVGVSIAAKSAAKVGDQFGDWRFQCRAVAAGQTNCALIQVLVAPKAKRPIAQYSLAKNPKTNEVFMTAILPLGIDLEAGTVLTIDESKPRPMTMKSCTAKGCIAIYKVDQNVLQLMKKGVKLKVTFKPLRLNKSVTLAGSLKGISAGISAAGLDAK